MPALEKRRGVFRRAVSATLGAIAATRKLTPDLPGYSHQTGTENPPEPIGTPALLNQPGPLIASENERSKTMKNIGIAS
ncbi:MAG: hypothetical protein ABWY45_23220, partial [Mycobacterium sp.]